MKIKTAKDGDSRYKWKFIWFPKYFSNGCWVWLEKVYVRQGYFSERIAIRGWYDICLSDPADGMPLKIN